MAKVEILMPTMGESIFECTVLNWLVKEGDIVQVDDMIIEVATDKIDTEIGSSHAGKILSFLVNQGDVAQIGKPICTIEIEAENEEEDNDNIKSSASKIIEEIEQVKKVVSTEETYVSNKFFSPLVLNIAKSEGVSLKELEQIEGTGLDGRVTKIDILNYLEEKLKAKSSKDIIAPVPSSESDTIVEMDRMRKMIAERMLESKRISPHVTSFIETDMTTIFKWRDKIKKQFVAESGENLTFTPILIEAVVKAIKTFPGINI